MKTKLYTKNIKTILFFSAFLVLSKISKAQDTIVQTNGTRIIAVVQEVGTTEIKYKKYANRETSPVYTIAKDQVSMIKYADGTKDVFNQGSTGIKPSPPVPPTPPANPPPVPPTPIENKNTLNNNGNNGKTSKLKYIYFGLRTSIMNSYDGGDFDNYWTKLFAAGGDGAPQLDQGFPSYKELVIGLSFQLSDKNNLNIESQDVISNSHALYNTAVFLDGTNGDMYFNLFSTSIAGQV
ncbi:MAG TPA: hypothetical protein VNG53_03835 [Bacteroidia bacterium]|nr:hypothetical protein [Bacteroidia bacterium]